MVKPVVSKRIFSIFISVLNLSASYFLSKVRVTRLPSGSLTSTGYLAFLVVLVIVIQVPLVRTCCLLLALVFECKRAVFASIANTDSFCQMNSSHIVGLIGLQ